MLCCIHLLNVERRSSLGDSSAVIFLAFLLTLDYDKRLTTQRMIFAMVMLPPNVSCICIFPVLYFHHCVTGAP